MGFKRNWYQKALINLYRLDGSLLERRCIIAFGRISVEFPKIADHSYFIYKKAMGYIAKAIQRLLSQICKKNDICNGDRGNY